ncbi:MAG TPA: cytochrome c oxidase assembly protein [Rhizomicrobium sp.]|jgi:cytochrome c oxidase assembly factor CtaG|nr:cytochrome c oxidase assembly protein [Rhizomicrobium sp.]
MRAVTRPLALAGALVTVALVLLPPLGTAAEHLFSAHMMQHLLLIVVAAPLLVLSHAVRVQDARLLRPLFRPVTAWLLFVGIFLFWHWPAAFQWAARNPASRLLEHATIFCSACFFWSVALAPRRDAALNYGARALFVMTAAVATDLPGVIMLFAPQAICTMPAENSFRWGLSPLEDQQIAGLLMWVPANLAFFSFATWLFARWISGDGQLLPHKSVTT